MVGAGVSVAAGIPDFRSANALYRTYGGSAFDLQLLRSEPDKFWAMIGSVFGPVIKGSTSD
jgi:NAD-dependent SIR2 family protein deacetylase